MVTRSLLLASLALAAPLHALDLDGDGMCDVWEARYHARSLAPDGDADGDGRTNAAEAEAGTDPFDPGSSHRAEFEGLAGGVANLGLPAQPGKRYQVYSAPSPDGPWTAEGGPTLALGDSLDLAAPRSGDRRFYRIEVTDADSDADGVSDWAELQLEGFDRTHGDSFAGGAPGHDLAVATEMLQALANGLVTGNATQPTAYEKDGAPAVVRFSRTSPTTHPFTLFLAFGGAADSTKSSASQADHAPLADRLVIPAGAAFADFTISPVADALTEVPEQLHVKVGGSDVDVLTHIADAAPTPANQRLLVGYLRPLAGTGWGGRAAELLHASYNDPSASKVSMSISLAGINSFQVGTTGEVVQYVVKETGTEPLSGFGTDYSEALNPDGSYKTGSSGLRFKAFEDIMRLTHDNLHEEEYNRIVARARATEGTIGAALTAAASSGVDFDTIFAGAAGKLGDQLKMVARLIAGRAALGNDRQVFFCQIGGYDTHQTLLTSHANLVGELADAMQAFHDALQALGVWNDVVTFTASDFNRTFTANNSDAAKAGSDHAWGSHAMVMGGAVNGGDIYGHFPSLKLGAATGSIDAGGGNRGRWIPDVSVDQYSAVLASWMGAGTSELEAIFPNLPRFDDPFSTASANLGFL